MADKKISALTAATTPLAGTEVLPIVQSGATVKVSVDNLTEGKTVKAADLQLPWNDDAEVIFRFDDSYKWGMKNPSADNRSLRVFSKAADGAGRIIFAYGNDVEGMRLETTGNVEVATGNVVMKTAGKGIDFSANTHAPGMTSELLDWYEEGTWTPNVSFSGATSSEGTYTRIGRQVTVRGSLTGASLSFGATAIVTDNLPFSIASPSTGVMVDAANTNGCLLQATGIWLVAATTLTPGVSQVVFTATYFT